MLKLSLKHTGVLETLFNIILKNSFQRNFWNFIWNFITTESVKKVNSTTSYSLHPPQSHPYYLYPLTTWLTFLRGDILHRKYDTIWVHSSNRTEVGTDWRSRRQTWREWYRVISWPGPSIVWTVSLVPRKSPSFRPKTAGCNISPPWTGRSRSWTGDRSRARTPRAVITSCNSSSEIRSLYCLFFRKLSRNLTLLLRSSGKNYYFCFSKVKLETRIYLL